MSRKPAFRFMDRKPDLVVEWHTRVTGSGA